MADEIRAGGAKLEGKVVINIDGKEKIKDLADTLNRISKGDDLHQYWKDEATLIDKVNMSLKNFNETLSNTDASKLVKSVNALKAITVDGDISSFFKNYDSLLDSFNTAVSKMGANAAHYDVKNFKAAFDSFDFIKTQGLHDIDDILSKITSSSNVDELRRQVDALNNSLAWTKRELRETESELSNFKAGSGVEDLEREIDRLRDQLQDVSVKAKEDFSAFLRANQLDTGEYSYVPYADYFEEIAQGSMSAAEAIGRFKVEYAHLLSDGSSGLDSSQIARFTELLETACYKIEEVYNEIQKFNGGTSFQNVAQELSQSVEFTDAQREAFRELSREGQNLTSIEPILEALVKNSDLLQGENAETAGSLNNITSAIKSMTDIEQGSVDSIRRLLTALGGLNNLTIGKSPIDNLARALSAIDSLTNSGNLNALSNLDLSTFNNLKVSKASMSNLANYLPEIAKVNVNKLKELSNVDFTNFNNLKVSKGAVTEISKIAEAVQILKEAKAASVDISDAGIKIDKSVSQEIKKVDQGLKDVATSAQQARADLSNSQKGYSDYLKEQKEREAQIEKDLIQQKKVDQQGYNTFVREKLANEAQLEKDLTQQKKADQQGYNNYLKEQKNKEAQIEKELVQQKKTDQQGYNEYLKERTVQEAQIEKELVQQKKTDQKGYSEYLKEQKNKEAQIEKELAQQKKAEQKGYNDYLKEQKNKEVQFAKEVASAKKQVAQEDKQRTTYLKRATTLLNQMQQAEKNWTKAGAIGSKSGGAYQEIKNSIQQLNAYVTDLNNKKITVEEFGKKVNELGLSFKVNSAEIRAAGENTQTLTDRIGKLSSKFGAWLSITRIIMGVIRTIKQMVKAVVEIDSAMTQLQIVTKATNDQMVKFGETAAQTSKEIGSTITDFTSSVTTFARLGYSLDESSALAKYTAMLQNVGDIDVSEAQDSITSIIKAFGISADEIESVMDKLVKTGKLLPELTVMCA